MRILVLLIFFSFCKLSFSQNRYEAFGIHDVWKIVDLESMTEVETPNYTDWHRAYLDLLCMKGDNFIDLYHKQKGFIKRFNQKRPESVRINDRTFFYFYDKDSTYLIPGIYSEKIVLPKRYVHLRSENGYLICKKDENYDVFISSNLNKPFLEDIKAADYFFREVVDKKDNKKLTLHLFFGKDHTLIYDSQFLLLQTLNSASDFFQVEQYILQDYIIMEDVPKEKDEVFITEGLFENDSKSMKIIKDATYTLKTNNIFDWSFYDDNNFLLLYNYDRNEYYRFQIDFENKIFLIPLDLQKEIGIQFEN